MAGAKDARPADDPGEPGSFEEALAALEETVRRLESGGLTLDESTGLYERGVRLARYCSERITAAELKINQVRTAYGQQMRMIEGSGPEADGDAG